MRTLPFSITLKILFPLVVLFVAAGIAKAQAVSATDASGAGYLQGAKSIGAVAVTAQQVAPSAPPLDIVLAAKTAMVVGTRRVVSQTKKSIKIWTTAKAEEALKKALTKWGRFQLVDDPAQADVILVIAEDKTASPLAGEQLREHLAIFPGGSLPSEYATPVWEAEAKQAAFGLGGRPTGKLIERLRKDLSEFEKIAAAPKAQPSEALAAPKSGLSAAPSVAPATVATPPAAAPKPAVAPEIPAEKAQPPESAALSERLDPAQTLLSAKTVAIVARGPKNGGGAEGIFGAMLGGPPQHIYANADRARKEVAKEITKWNRYTAVDDPATADLVIFVREWNLTEFKLNLVAQMRVLKGGPSWDQSGQVLWEKQDKSDFSAVTKRLVSQFRRDVEKLAKGPARTKE